MILSPILVILAVPLGIGIGLDVFDAVGKTPIVLALCVPLAIVALRHLPAGAIPRGAVARLRARLHLGHAIDLIQAP